MFKVQEFYCEDIPVDADIRKAIIYANTHNCAVKITTWLVSPVCRMLSEQIQSLKEEIDILEHR